MEDGEQCTDNDRILAMARMSDDLGRLEGASSAVTLDHRAQTGKSEQYSEAQNNTNQGGYRSR